MTAERSVLRAQGMVRVPGDKSVSHRALLLAALARGQSRLSGLPDSEDVRTTRQVLQALGVTISDSGGRVTVHGHGVSGLRPPATPLRCANSGTTARLVAGVAAALPFDCTLMGDESLSRRPMRRVAEPLRAMGAAVELSPRGTLPMHVQGGSLRAIDWHTAVPSAQVKSAILLAGLAAGVEVCVSEPAPSRDHTERMLRYLGAEVEVHGATLRLRAGGSVQPFDLHVPGDPSSAAFLAGFALLAGEGAVRVEEVLLNDTRVGWINVLRRMGAQLHARIERESGGEPVGYVEARPSALRGTEVDAHEIPALIDELPLIGCLAVHADGVTRVRGATELRVKESDRIAALVDNLRTLGADAEELEDGFVVHGTRRRLTGRVQCGGDHRIAMAFGVLAAMPGHAIEIDDPHCARVSFPGFWRTLEQLGAHFTVPVTQAFRDGGRQW